MTYLREREVETMEGVKTYKLVRDRGLYIIKAPSGKMYAFETKARAENVFTGNITVLK